MPKKTTAEILALNAGDLRHEVVFMRQSIITDTSGAVPTWTDFAVVRAAIEPYSGRELIRAGVDVTQVLITITMRYRDDIEASMRVRSANGTYIIQGVQNILERNRVLKLTCLGIGEND